MRLTTFLAAACGLLAAPAWGETQDQLLNQGPPKTSQMLPDPGHIPMVFGKDIPWKGDKGERSAALFGDPSKPGIYGVLIQWQPGHNSQPHFHSTDRYIYVVSGTWWVSSSDHYDPATTWPLPQGSFATDLAGKVHWDGSKDEDLILLVTGMGPMKTVTVPDSGAKGK